MLKIALRLLTAGAVLLLAPCAVFAQASVTGTVRDASDAVLPGVTVEASSPALIERSRIVSTDESGQYRIVDLRPGLAAEGPPDARWHVRIDRDVEIDE